HRAQRFVGHRVERALIAERGQFLGQRMRGEQPDESLGVMRIDAAEPHILGFYSTSGKFTPPRHRWTPPGPHSLREPSCGARSFAWGQNHGAAADGGLSPL